MYSSIITAFYYNYSAEYGFQIFFGVSCKGVTLLTCLNDIGNPAVGWDYAIYRVRTGRILKNICPVNLFRDAW
jgi:hypothetical protein